MQKIIDNKLYDTDTAERLLIINISKGVSTFVYRTRKGAYFGIESDGTLLPLTEGEVRSLLGRYGSVERYTQLFGAPEEA